MRAASPLRRSAAVLAAVVLPLSALSACGSEDDKNDAALDAVSVSGEVGDPPQVEISERLEPEGFASEVVVEGDGETIEEDDVALLQAWVGNGYTQREAFSTYDYTTQGAESYAPDLIRISTSEPSTAELQSLQQTALAALVNPDTTALPKSIVDSLIGVKGGSRVVIVTDSDSAFGATGQSSINIGNKDSVVFVVDVLEVPLDGPDGTEVAPAEGAPALVETDGTVTGFDFTDAAEPGDDLQVIPLIEGDGPVVEEGATLIANYLGQVYQAEAPFDESYSGGLPRDFVVGGDGAQVIDGWSQGLVGLKQGSRVILVVPPDLGYGSEGNEGAGISGTDTLYFVVDVLGSVVVRIPPEETETAEPDATDATDDPTASESGDPEASETPQE